MMNSIREKQEQLTCFFLMLLMAGIFLLEFARVLPSLAMGGLLLTALLSNSPAQLLRNFYTNKLLLIFSMSFLFLLPTYFYSDNTHYFWERIQIQAPTFALPFAFANLRPLSKKQYHAVLYFFIGFLLVVTLGSLFIYATNFEAINTSYLHSKVIPNPFHVNHVRLSLLLAIGIFTCYYLYTGNFYIRYVQEKKAVLVAGIFLIIFMHIYSVRSGMLGFYAVSLLLIMYTFIIQKKRYVQGLVLLGILALLPVAAMYLSPTLRNKTVNTTNDLQHYQSGQSVNNYPMGTRFLSYQIALEIASENYLLGCGLGDLEDKLQERYINDHPTIAPRNRIIPHNQFIYYFAATGLLGLLIFCVSFYYPLLFAWKEKVMPVLINYTIVSLSFMVEPTLETQLGVAVAITFILLPLWMHKPTSDAR
ncbi:MAG TPA: O-antigen ligase family protein [Bacteroidia bacterium]|nr:O-antigen ligase family protein [Bacteroidia bacterium]